MKSEGLPLEILLRRLTECPPEFWDTSLFPSNEPFDVHSAKTVAIACDLCRAVERDFDPQALTTKLKPKTANHSILLRIVAWLLYDDWFVTQTAWLDLIIALMACNKLIKLSSMVDAKQFVMDPDRREELARIALAELELRPRGETVPQATDRLTTLDSVERDRILKATLAAEKRAREVREAMERAKAQESASRYGE
jgi:hypothetical protein